MENSFICKPKKQLSVIYPPPSKSVMQRVVASSVFCNNPITIYNPSYCQDSLAALTMANALGVFKLESCDTTILKQTQPQHSGILDCNDSGLAFRMFVPIAAAIGGQFQFILGSSLKNRPLKFMEEVLHQSNISTHLSDDLSTFTIQGQLKAGRYKMDGSISSQFLTGMLMALPTLNKDSLIEVQGLKSRHYIDLTLKTLDHFGIKIENKDYQQFVIYGNQKYVSETITVESDWSNAAFALVLGAISHELQVKNLNIHSSQPDKAILSVLEKCGASIKIAEQSITVSKSTLQPFSFDAENFPDLVPPLVVLAACCNGISTIHHVERLKFKESNRIEALLDVFQKMKVVVHYEDDTLKIHGGKIQGGKVDSFNDHRIAMAAGIASFVAENPVEIQRYQCVEKSYPNFWIDFFEKTISQ